MKYRSLPEIRNAISRHEITLPDLVNGYLKRIEERHSLNAFLEVFGEEALQRAEEIQHRIEAGTAGKLAGMVIAIKDNICYKNHRVSASSKILENYTSIYSATAVERLLAEDAIIIGRTNCDEFAMGSSNESSYYGRVANPLNEALVPGGSSGGSAAAVAADLCLVALGSDTGGSIRQPASFCGLVGVKPTYARVSRYGLLAYGSSFDQIGPFSHTAYDSALVMEVMSGVDPMDSTSDVSPVPAYTTEMSERKPLKIAILRDCIESPGLSPEVKANFEKVIQNLTDAGHSVGYVDFPYLDYVVPSYYVLTTAEASSNLSRYDGIHFGFRSPQGNDLAATYKKSRSEGFGAEVKRRILLGTFVLSSGYYDAYYSQAQKVRRILYDATASIFKEYDVIASPTTPGVAFPFGQNADDPVAMYLEDIFTVHANLVGTPAISMPSGTNSAGLPTSIQFMAPWFEEGRLFSIASETEG